ncbi:hypothetical protein J416_10271 [Gracilibacillus halophilus YIM-C55.5]|uniref:YlxP-like protein n=1 Tax=Gracilibacillus halophilus YIM-C55.5 TaxID=1308866 RepID=N4WTW0_9BACI|nr:DUF503 domain-containing protein [Gracilibacillus halophilus]ENH96546.1 hypothetical protein J416_10271 [Gracilibacillus halophilus YIM-C55.5]
MVVYAEVELLLYEPYSLKDKRSILSRLKNQLHKQLNVAVSEIDFQDIWQRSRLAIVTVSSSKDISEKIIQQAIDLIDSFLEVERTITNVEVR